jgi:tetratricopeptide (TPR) repeat protein
MGWLLPLRASHVHRGGSFYAGGNRGTHMSEDTSQALGVAALGCLLAAALLAGGVVRGAETTGTGAGKDPVSSHLERAQSYLEQGEYAKAVLEFEQVLRFDNLPPDLRQQAEIYSKAARNYREGKRLSGYGYAETGGGYYRENVTSTTEALGGDPARDWFWKARIGGGLSYFANNDITVDGGLDYRYRYYDDANRRDDSDLRWNAAVIQSLDNGSQSIGVRGRASYRGDDGYRQDYGLFVNRAFVLDPDNRITLEGEIRSRRYPSGDERERSRDIAQVWLGWTRALMDGKGAVTFTVNAGREWATHDRAGGDQTIYGAEIDWGMDINDRLSLFLFGLWEHNGYHEDVPRGEVFESTVRPELDMFELGGGLTYAFSPGWSLRPELLYIKDDGNTLYSDYSSTEVWVSVRKSF